MQTRLEAFREWIKTANTGQVYTYYTGFLSIDRGTIVDIGDGLTEFEPNGDIDALATTAINAFENNRVHLFQRKIHDNEYEYIAMKRRDGGRVW